MQVLTPKGYKHLVSISKKTQDDPDNNMTIVAGDYVLIQATPEGSRYPAEIIRVVDHEYETYCRENNLWPTPYDIEGYVERLAEKVHFAEEVPKPRCKVYNGDNKALDIIINGPCRYFHSKSQGKEKKKQGKASITSNKKASKKISRRDLLCRKMCKSDKDCILNSPYFPDVDLPTMANESLVRISAHCLTDITPTLTCSTSTKNACEMEVSECCTVAKPVSSKTASKCCTLVKPVCSGTACCCQKSCGGAKCQPPIQKNTIGSGPSYCFITVGRDQLPPLYGICTPWQTTKKRMKQLREERETSLFTKVNKE